MKDDVIGFNEISIKPSDSTFIIDGTLKDFKMNYHKNEDKLLRLAYGCQGNDAINGTSIISLKKDNFTDCIFILMLVYQKRQCHKMKLVKCWVFILLVANSVDVIVGYFKYDL